MSDVTARENNEGQSPRLMIWPKRLCYLAYGVGALVVANALGLSWVKAAAFFLPLVLVELLLRRWVEVRMSRFDQALMAHMQAGRDDELERFLSGQRLLWFAAPQYYLQSKWGLVYRHLGQHSAAAAAFREALDQAPGNKRFAQALNLADSLNQVGADEEAEKVFRLALDGEHRSVSASASIARLVLKRSGDLEEAEAYMQQAVEWQGGGPLRCELIEILTAQGKQEEARGQHQRAQEEAKRDGWTAEELARLAAAAVTFGEKA